MKIILNLFFYTIFSFFLLSCEVNHSVKKDLSTGEFSRGNGISCKDIALEINGKEEKRTEFVYGEEINVIFKNVSGLKKVDNKYFPAIAMVIIKNDKDTVYSEPNLLETTENISESSPLRLNAFFTCGLPHKNNEKYMLYVTIWDKKSDGKFQYSLPFKVKENELLKIKTSNIIYSNIYLWDETNKKAIVNNKVNRNNLLYLFMEGVEGFDMKDNKVFPMMFVELKNNEGKNIISNSNLLASIENTGASPEDLKKLVNAQITFTDGILKNPYSLKVILKDKLSSKSIEVITKIEVE